MIADEVRYCLRCGSTLTQTISFGQLRPTCPQCGWVYFPDPKVAIAVLIRKDGNILLVRRINEPQRGCWTLPAGFLDAGEDPIAAAKRECLEETGLTVEITGLFDILAGKEHARGSDLLIVYLAEIISGQLQPGDDADEAVFFSLQSLPPLAFKTTELIISRLSNPVNK